MVQLAIRSSRWPRLLRSWIDLGGHHGLIEALAGHGLIVQHCLCLSRDAVEYALEDAEVTVPVDEEQVYWYPLAPKELLQNGRKLIHFRPPAETLQGERLHQWIGARRGTDGSSTDLDRIRRQQTLLRCLWANFDFGRAVENPDWVQASSAEAYVELRKAQVTWQFDTFADVEPRMIAGMAVLVNRQHVSRVRRFRWWLSAWLDQLRRRTRLARHASS